MKKIIISMLLALALLLLTGCPTEYNIIENNETDTKAADETDTKAADETDTKVPESKDPEFKSELVEKYGCNPDAPTAFDLPEYDIYDVYIQCYEYALFDDAVPGCALILYYEEPISAVTGFLVVETEKGLSVEDDPQGMWQHDLYTCDTDGDGYDEIVLHESLGGAGGAGSYRSRIVDYKNYEMVFTYDDYDEILDSGLILEEVKGTNIVISSSLYGYREEFACVFDEDVYLEFIETKAEDYGIMVDTCFTFEPRQLDDDGEYEIYCEQYVSLWSHADGIGDAVTVLDYDKDSGEYVINDTYFVPLEGKFEKVQ